jgi:hypothetical protein
VDGGFLHRFGSQRGGGLHLFLRDAAREIIVEKANRMAQRPAVQPALDQGRQIGRQDNAVERRRGCRLQSSQTGSNHQRTDRTSDRCKACQG